ncbi:MAG: hypothetical protein GWN01_11280, partial [Nitrosopumilaceae archaeon]|nr:hypothetical protein [Nitrosopumilaceae archaeon]NIU87889.1 hypothetical protein [Nitrosopumilaceae archaeon]NIV66187.1 hypothetical protein [Nitrosopumilaceae archaeon]NIX62068.1 hypothetical protein [Nitrosopumilaceae archaeon]
IFKFVSSLEKINFIETYVNKQSKKPDEQKKGTEGEKQSKSSEQPKKEETPEQKTN